MRVTNQMIHSNANYAMSQQNDGVNKALAELSSGKRINQASDDPVGASMVMQYQSKLDQLETNGSNQGYAALATDDYITTLKNISNNLQNVMTSTVQVQNGAIQNSDWTKISSGLSENFNNILAFSNQKNSIGQYMFSGNMNTVPFTGDLLSGVTYHGDNGIRDLPISDNQSIQMNIPGSFLFNSSLSRAEITYPATTTAKLTITTPTLMNNEGAFTVTGAGTGTFTDTSGNVSPIAWSGNTITMDNITVKLEGTLNVGDTFQFKNPAPSNLMSDIQELVNITKNAPTNDSDKMKTLSRINELQQRLSDHFGNIVNHEVLMGGQANRIQNQTDLDADYSINLKKNKSRIEEVDFAEAATRLTAYQQAQEATRASYIKIASLSLFDYLK